jgi:hypothetical protein
MIKKPPERPTVFLLWYQAKDYQKKLFVLVSIFSELFLSLMSSNLMLFSFSSTRHCRAPYHPALFSVGTESGWFCNYRTIMRVCQTKVKGDKEKIHSYF